MIKKIIKIFQPYMIRPTVYQCITKISIALVLSLLWNRFINKEGYFSVVTDAFLVLGIFFFMLAWFQYLRLDGVRSSLKSGKNKETKKNILPTKDIVDFADEKIVSFSELDDDEQIVCRFVGNIICGLLFFVPALLTLIM